METTLMNRPGWAALRNWRCMRRQVHFYGSISMSRLAISMGAPASQMWNATWGNRDWTSFHCLVASSTTTCQYGLWLDGVRRMILDPR